MKKISIIGRGTVGCLSVAHYLTWTDYEVEWIFDPKIETSPVGEGTNLVFPRAITNSLNFNSGDLTNINSVPKLGIWKRGWGKGKEFYHTFPADAFGIHFNAVEFQNYVFNQLVNHPRLQVIEDNVMDLDCLDSDYVMICTGSPKQLTDDFVDHKNIPVNAAMVFQCPWPNPKFLYSLTFAKKYGWVFGIPLNNRCAIGYVYNKNFCTEEDVKNDVQSILDEFELVPAITRKLNFYNYSRKVNFTDRVCYNGNASFFLEPLEATSTGLSDRVNRLSYDLWIDKKYSLEEVESKYHMEISDVEGMICLHYLSGSVHRTDFWKYAKQMAEEKINDEIKKKSRFCDFIKHVALSTEVPEGPADVGSWPIKSYISNITNLGLTEKLKFILTK